MKILSKTEEWAFQNSGRRKKLPKQVSGGEELYVQAVNVALQLDLSRNNVIPVTSIPITHAKKQCITMAEDNSVFICKTCKPSVDTQERRPKTNENLTCRKCDFKSAFRYNLKRHIDNVHDGNDLPEETGALNEEELQVGSEEQVVLDNKHCNPSNITPPRKAELRDILDELNFINLLENFESEGVDLEVLKSMGKTTLKTV